MERIRQSGNRAILSVERWFNMCFGHGLNPLYHLGSLTFFFFWVVLVSGIYVFIFFKTSVDGAYPSVEYMTHEQWWLAGIMRSLHRYASDAAVITVFLHMFREFFRDRYRGVRWFSWFTGVPTLWILVLLGVSGYWLVWDMMAQYVAIATAELMDWIPIIPGSMAFNFLAGHISDRFFTLMAFLHLAGFPVALVFMLWIHVSRISNVDFNPPRGLLLGTLFSLIVLSLIKPALSHGPANLAQSPTVLHLDWFYLNIYPFMDKWGAGWAWGVSTGITFLLMVLPWLPPRREAPPAQVDLSNCNGCGGCARDCPFGAAAMQPRTDGRRNTPFQSFVDPSLCTACGICVGSCNASNPFRKSETELKVGIHMPDFSIDQMRDKTDQALKPLVGEGVVMVFGCDHGVDLSNIESQEVGRVTLPCTGMLPPSFIDYALKKGADGVVITGCGMGDCYHRLGNQWMEERLVGEREPSLFKRTDKERVLVSWVSANDVGRLNQDIVSFRQKLVAQSEGEQQ